MDAAKAAMGGDDDEDDEDDDEDDDDEDDELGQEEAELLQGEEFSDMDDDDDEEDEPEDKVGCCSVPWGKLACMWQGLLSSCTRCITLCPAQEPLAC